MCSVCLHRKVGILDFTKQILRPSSVATYTVESAVTAPSVCVVLGQIYLIEKDILENNIGTKVGLSCKLLEIIHKQK